MIATAPELEGLQDKLRCALGAQRLISTMAEAWAPRPAVSLVDWIPENVYLPTSSTAGGRLRLDGPFTYWRGVVEALIDPIVEKITVMAGTQLGKTSIAQGCLAGLGATSPAPMMLVAPDKPSSRKWREKFYELCEASPALRDLIPPPHRRNELWVGLKWCRVHLGHSYNLQTLSGEPCQRVIMTEVDRYSTKKSTEGDAMELAGERHKMFSRGLDWAEGTPTLAESSRIAMRYGESDRRRYHVPCPRCGWYQPLRFYPHAKGPRAGRGGIQGIKDGAGNWLRPFEGRESAWYQCEECGKRIEDHEKTAMVEAGVWCPEGQSVDAEGFLRGRPERPGRHQGFHLWTGYAPVEVVTWGKIAEKYLAARQYPTRMRSFVNNWLGEAYRRERRSTEWTELKERLSTKWVRGTVPPEAVFLTAGIDVQGDENGVYFVIRAWWARGGQCTSSLVDYGHILPQFGKDGEILKSGDLEMIDSLVLDRVLPRYGTANQSMIVRLSLADSGHRTSEIYRYARGRPAKRLRLIKGDTRVGQTVWTKSVIERSPDNGEPIAGGQELWLLNVDHFKEDIQSRWVVEQDVPGAWCFCANPSEQYMREVTNEVLVIEKREADGKLKHIWKPRDTTIGVDYWDCEVYARAAAEMVVGLNGWPELPAMAAAAGIQAAPAVTKESGTDQPRQGVVEQPRPKKGKSEKRESNVRRIDRPGGWAAR